MSKLFICSFMDKTTADGAAKLLDEKNIKFSLKSEDGGVSLYGDSSDEEKILAVVKAYEKELQANGTGKSLLRRYAETLGIVIIAITALVLYVCGIDTIIEFIKKLI